MVTPSSALVLQVSQLCTLLSGVIADTKGKLEKKQAQTYEEMMVRPQGVHMRALHGACSRNEALCRPNEACGEQVEAPCNMWNAHCSRCCSWHAAAAAARRWLGRPGQAVPSP